MREKKTDQSVCVRLWRRRWLSRRMATHEGEAFYPFPPFNFLGLKLLQCPYKVQEHPNCSEEVPSRASNSISSDDGRDVFIWSMVNGSDLSVSKPGQFDPIEIINRRKNYIFSSEYHELLFPINSFRVWWKGQEWPFSLPVFHFANLPRTSNPNFFF